MNIDKIETLVRGPVAVVRITTDDGAVGVGQTAPYEAAMSAHVLHEIVAPFFLGKDPWDVEALVDHVLRATYKFPSSFILRALGGIDTACWDLMGRAAGVPVFKLLGGAARQSVPMYASSMLRSITPEEEAERLAALVSEQGFTGVKIRIGQEMGRDADVAPGRTEKIIPLMRQVLGDGVDISADANGGYSRARAIQVGRLLEEQGYFHYEEPVPFGEVEQLVHVTRALDIPVSGGEQDTLLPQFHRLLSTGAVDIIQPDICYIGGVSRARKVGVMAEAMGLPVTPHCANHSLLQVFSLHLAAALPAAFQRQEWSIEDIEWTKDLYAPMLTVADGEVALPSEPGWGIELSDVFLDQAEVRVSTR